MDTYPVYLNRPWLDHSTNSFSGWTITVTAQTGAIVVSALALLVQMAGEAMWSIVAFSLHQSRTTLSPQTGLFRQLQVILRNPSNSLFTSVEILKAGWAWRGNIHGPVRKALLLAAWPILLFISFTIAGIFVATVTVPAYEINQILLRPTDCGMQVWTVPLPPVTAANIENGPEIVNDWFATTTGIRSKSANDIRRSRAYANSCYNNPNKTVGCTNLPAQELPYSVQTGLSCPFGQRCLGTIQFDSGTLDSHTHLGINAKSSDRVNFQFITTCSVINIDDRIFSSRDPYSNGSFPLLSAYLDKAGGSTNYTYQYATVQASRVTGYTVE
jgi:hypothetical protein